MNIRNVFMAAAVAGVLAASGPAQAQLLGGGASGGLGGSLAGGIGNAGATAGGALDGSLHANTDALGRARDLASRTAGRARDTAAAAQGQAESATEAARSTTTVAADAADSVTAAASAAGDAGANVDAPRGQRAPMGRANGRAKADGGVREEAQPIGQGSASVSAEAGFEP